MTDESGHRDIESVAEAAADKAVGKVFSELGVDLSDQIQRNALRADLVHARKVRHLWERGGFRIFMIVLSVAAVGVLSMFWTGFTDTIKK
jgi:hypothetical protein